MWSNRWIVMGWFSLLALVAGCDSWRGWNDPPEEWEPCQDLHEGNDAREWAVPIVEGEYPDLRLCRDEGIDFFSIDLDADDRLAVQLTFSHDDGDIDFCILNSEGQTVACERSSNDDEVRSYQATRAGTYYIRVVIRGRVSVSDGVAYDMSLDVTPADDLCSDDEFEGNSSIETALLLEEGEYQNLRLCRGEETDYFSIDLEADDQITLGLSFFHNEANIDFCILNSEGQPVACGRSSDDNEERSYLASEGGTYFVQVTVLGGIHDEGGVSYDMTIDVTPIADLCGDDEYMEADSLERAAAIVPGVYDGLRLCPADAERYFSLDLGVGDEITVSLDFSYDEGNIDFCILNSEGLSVACERSRDDNEERLYTATTGGRYFIRTMLNGRARDVEGVVYDMTLAVHSPCPESLPMSDSDCSPWFESECLYIAPGCGADSGIMVSLTCEEGLWASDGMRCDP